MYSLIFFFLLIAFIFWKWISSVVSDFVVFDTLLSHSFVMTGNNFRWCLFNISRPILHYPSLLLSQTVVILTKALDFADISRYLYWWTLNCILLWDLVSSTSWRYLRLDNDLSWVTWVWNGGLESCINYVFIITTKWKSREHSKLVQTLRLKHIHLSLLTSQITTQQQNRNQTAWSQHLKNLMMKWKTTLKTLWRSHCFTMILSRSNEGDISIHEGSTLKPPRVTDI